MSQCQEWLMFIYRGYARNVQGDAMTLQNALPGGVVKVLVQYLCHRAWSTRQLDPQLQV
jgi:hypothetical protein